MASSRRTAQRRRSQAMARPTIPTRLTPPPPADPDLDGENEAGDRVASTPGWPAAVGLAICALGLADAAYLTYAHYTSASVLACSDKGLFNCAAVTTSSYSHILGLPVAVLGLVYFAAMVPLLVPAAWRSPNRYLRLARLAASVVGIGMVLWLVYVELVKLGAVCEYCTGVHILTFGLFVVVALGTIATTAVRE